METSILRGFFQVIAYVLINCLWLLFTCYILFVTESVALALPAMLAWVWIRAMMMNDRDAERTQRPSVVAIRGATRREEEDFQPTRYFRMRKRRGWRNVEVEIDDAIEIPNVEIIPVQELSSDISNYHGALFEYRGQLFYGSLFL